MSLVVPVWFAQFSKKRLEPRDGPAMPFHFAGPVTFFSITGGLALPAEAFAELRGVLGSGDEFSAIQVEVAFTRAFLGQAQAVAEFQLGLVEIVFSQSSASYSSCPALRESASGPAMTAPGCSTDW